MIEAKFHNELAMKSDLKVALYIKARFEDLSKSLFEYGGKKRKLDEGWLITNTKFTDQAIKYGECNDLKMLGWNYPSRGNLHDVIEQLRLHPFTCLSTLTDQNKKDLLGRGVILCRDILDNKAILNEVGINGIEYDEIIKEAEMIVTSNTVKTN